MSIKIIVSDASNDIQTYQDAINLAGQKLVEQNIIDPKYITACLERELDFPTGLQLTNGEGVAMPHGNSDLVKTDGISVIRTKNKVSFGRMEDKDQKVECSLVFNLALSSGQQHIGVLRKMVRLFQDEAFIQTCQSGNNKDVESYIVNILEE